jgi:hypothetical protein
MEQMAWTVGAPMGPAGRSTSIARRSVPADPISYRTSGAAWLLVAPLAGLAVVMVRMEPPAVVMLFVLAIWGWAGMITTYRVECDGIELHCASPLWRRSIPVGDVRTVQAPTGVVVSGGQSTVTPRKGPRMVLLVLTKTDRAKLTWFLDRLEAMAPDITIRR